MTDTTDQRPDPAEKRANDIASLHSAARTFQAPKRFAGYIPTHPEQYAQDVANKAFEMLLIRDAKRALADHEASTVPQPVLDIATVGEHIENATEPPWRAIDLIPANAGTLIVAQRKTGKTTLTLNAAHAFVTGETLLGRFDVTPASGPVALLNFEVSGPQIARWAVEAGFDEDWDDLLVIANMRGVASPLKPGRTRDQLAERLNELEVETLIVDPFGRAYTGQSQNDAGEVAAWLHELDTFARTEVGAKDVILTTHAGWNADRSRGSSALEDWADSIIYLTRDDEGRRFLRAEGRDVLIDEDELHFDDVTRKLSLAGTGSRKVAAAHRRTEALIEPITDILRRFPGSTGKQVTDRLREAGVSFSKGEEGKALKLGVGRGYYTVARGPHAANHYALAHLPEFPATFPQARSSSSPRSPIGSGEDNGEQITLNLPGRPHP